MAKKSAKKKKTTERAVTKNVRSVSGTGKSGRSGSRSKTTEKARPACRTKSAAQKKPAAKKKLSATASAKQKSAASKKRKPAHGGASATSSSAAEKSASTTRYDAKKVSENNKQRAAAADRREIGAIPPPKNPERRSTCERDLEKYLATYFPNDVVSPWSEKHLRLIRNIQIVVLSVALQAIGFPRGWAKTFITVRAIMWAGCYRHHIMMMLIAASDEAAKELLQDIVDEIHENQLLQEDFPEFCLPILALENIRQRGKGQTCGGEPTNVKQADFELCLGDVNGKAGVVIYAGGITGSRIRGKRKKRGGRIERPTLGLIDDFQTDASALSKLQVRKRLKLINGAVKGLAGNNRSWSCLLTCTVIVPGDAADQILDRRQYPDWRGIRESFLESLPNEAAMEHWEEWYRLHAEWLQTFDEDINNIDDEPIAPAAQTYYRKHRKAMNAGAKVVWKYAFDPDVYIDALEKAMHWYFSDREAFWCELMNQPDKLDESGTAQLSELILCKRWSPYDRHVIPAAAEHLTVFADVSKAVLWYEIRAWAMDSTSWTIDYGTFPQQKRSYFTQSSAKQTIEVQYKHLPDWETRCKAAIRDLFVPLFEQHFQREDGHTLRLKLAGIDANDFTDEIKEGIQLAGLQDQLWPMHSRNFQKTTPLNEQRKRDGDYVGDHWRRRNPPTGRMRYITYETNVWKSHHRDRLLMPVECRGSISWYRGKEHKMLADHHTAEWSQVVHFEKTDRRFEQWEEKPNEDNHLWDVGVGNDVLGSVLGLKLPAGALLGVESGPAQPKRGRRRKSRRRRR